jgi:tRNA 2-selenouridine synthase
MLIKAVDYPDLFLEDRPFLDVRAEVEFNKGAFPTAVNIPILNDAEREEIGIIYKQHGSAQAVSAGHKMVSGELKSCRIAQWEEFIRNNPQACLYCFRGGQRSTIAAEWLLESGIDIPRIEGGYKALRRFLIDGTSKWAAGPELYIVGGKTGTGKTRVLHRFKAHLDLEALASHRGSAFGKRLTPQPTQINFENLVAIALLKFNQSGCKQLLVEDESLMIGRSKLPDPLFAKMKNASMIVVDDVLQARVDRIYEEYIIEQWAEYQDQADSPDAAFEAYAGYLLSSLRGISKRLGGTRYKAMKRLMETALDEQQQGEPELHKAWIAELLTHYYDPMYAYQLEKKQHRIQFCGSHDEITDWLYHQGFVFV